MIDDKIAGFRFLTLTERELHEFAERAGRNFETPQAARELDDVDLRLKHMDELGIDVQVLHNTFWIERITTRPDAEAALCRSWNRWLADISKKSNGRLFYSCVVPAMSIDAAIEEIKFARENGAAAVCMRPLEGERHLSDPYFYPLYQIAADLDLAIAVHIANGNPENADLYRLAPAGRFAQFRVPTVTACFDVIMSELHEDVSQAPLGIRRSIGSVGAVDLPRSGDPLPRRRPELFPGTYSRNTRSSSPARPTTTCRISSAVAAKTG